MGIAVKALELEQKIKYSEHMTYTMIFKELYSFGMQ